jgi:hypothetical protein
LASKYVLSALKPEVSTALSATATVGYMLKNIDNQTTLPTRVARTVYMAAWPRVARRCAGFSRPQLEPGGESPEEAQILAGILPKFFDLGQGAIGETIYVAGAGQFGRLHKEALDDSSI